jgi:hypothetical protein
MSQQFATIRSGMRRGFAFSFLPCIVLAAMAIPPQSRGPSLEDQLEQYKEKYVRENDPIRKAKALAKLGDLQIAEFTRQASASDMDAAFLTLTMYRGEVSSTFDAMKATHIDAEKKPDGFKELQIHLRKTVLKLDRATSLVQTDRRVEYREIRDEMSSIDNELFHMLFPREAGSKGSGDQ